MVAIPTGMGNYIVMAAKFGIALIVIVVTFGWFFVMRNYSIRATIYEQTGMGVKVKVLKARRIDKLGGSKLKFLGRKEVMALPTNNYFFPVGKDGWLINLYRDKSNNLHPIPLRWDEKGNPLHVPDDSDMRFWLTNHLKEAEEAYRKGDFWSKYGQIIMLGAAMAFCAVIMIVYGKFYFDGINNAAGTIGGQLGSLEETLRTIGGIGG